MTGIGFLGAGALIQSRNGVRGMTTAATIWLVAAIGMSVGADAHFLAIFTTILSTGILVLLHPLSRHLEERARRRKSYLRDKDDQVGQGRVAASDRVKVQEPSDDA